MAAELTITQVAERTGLSVDTLRFYEREGIVVTPVRRTAGGRRRYDEDAVGWLTVCTILRASGMPIPDIRRYTELVRAGTGNERERLAIMRAHRERVRAQQEVLARSLDLITYKVGVYEDVVDAADAADTDDTAAEGATTCGRTADAATADVPA